MLRKKGIAVPPRNIAGIRETAGMLRNLLHVLGVPCTGKIDIVRVLDIHLPSLFPNFSCLIVEDDELGDHHARTYPDRQEIQIKKSVYEGARRGGGRDIFTIAHELGHLFLHRGAAAYARAARQKDHPIFCDSEWQADCYAAEFLMPLEEVMSCGSAAEVQERFGVSFEAARVRWDKCRR